MYRGDKYQVFMFAKNPNTNPYRIFCVDWPMPDGVRDFSSMINVKPIQRLNNKNFNRHT